MLATKPKATKRTIAQLQAEAALELLRRQELERGEFPLFREYPNDPVGWIEKHFYIPETPDHRIILSEYQRECLRVALTKDANKHFPYSLIVWSDIKKSIKSTIAGAVALWMAWNTEWGSIKIVANDLKQADSREMYYIRRAIELNPQMKELVKINLSGYTVKFPNHAVIEAVPVDPGGEAGGNDDAIFYTEMWAAKGEAAQQMWTETTLSSTKMGKSFRWVETYAGFTGKSPILERLWESNVKDGIKRGLQFPWANKYSPPLEVFENRETRTFALWNTVPRVPWATPEYYAQEAANLLPSEFNRVHRNQWATASDAFVQPEWWDACKGNMIEHDKESTHIMALDAAVSGDTFGIVLVSGNQDDTFYVRYARGWEPPANGGHIDFSEVEKEIRRLCEVYNVAEICYDPYQLEDMSQRLKAASVAHMFPFIQGLPRAKADKVFRDVILARRIHHDGDPKLREHVTNADAKAEGDHLRIIKRNQNMKIDLCVCTSMALARAIKWNI